MSIIGDIVRTNTYEEIVKLIETHIEKQKDPNAIQALQDLKREVQDLIQPWY